MKYVTCYFTGKSGTIKRITSPVHEHDEVLLIYLDLVHVVFVDVEAHHGHHLVLHVLPVVELLLREDVDDGE